MTTDSELIDELTTLEAAATPLPWRSVKIAYPDNMAVVVRDGTRDPIFHDGIVAGIAKEADADLTEATRNHLPRLLALARRSASLEAEAKVTNLLDATELRRIISHVERVIADAPALPSTVLTLEMPLSALRLLVAAAKDNAERDKAHDYVTHEIPKRICSMEVVEVIVRKEKS